MLLVKLYQIKLFNFLFVLVKQLMAINVYIILEFMLSSFFKEY